MTQEDKRMHPIHFGSDPANIRIRINPEIQIREKMGLNMNIFIHHES